MKRIHVIWAGAVLLASGGAALAASAGDTIAARHANFKVMGKGFKAVSDQLKAGSPDIAAIRAGAAAIDGAARKVAGGFPKGTGPESGVRTHALPAIWQKNAEFRADADKLVGAATALKAAADAGDLGRVKAAAGALGGTCKACHDSFREKD